MSGAYDAVLNYMTVQNRPYSTNDIAQNLHNEFSKSVIQKNIDSLVKDEKLVEKTNGKQKAYVINQSCLPAQNAEELKELEQKIDMLTKDLETSNRKLHQVQSELTSKKAILTTEQAKVKVKELRERCHLLNTEIEEILESNKENDCESSSATQLSKDELEKLVKRKDELQKLGKKRKRICGNVIDVILESYPKKKKELIEQIGIDED